MIVLALETSCESGSVALWVDGAILERELVAGTVHSATALPAVHALLAEAQLAPGALDAIAFGAGPGAFTGVRLACALAQGLACGLDIAVAPVGTLEALAEACPHTQIYCAMDARMQEIYVAAYRRDGERLEEVLAPSCVLPQEAPPVLHNDAWDDGLWHGCGNAFAVYADSLHASLGACVRVYAPTAVPLAGNVARIAVRTRHFIDPVEAAPMYVRNKVALTIAERAAAGGKP